MVPPLPIGLADLLTIDDYAAARADYLGAMLAHRDRRRVSLGGSLTLTFESRDTVLHQVHEVLHLEYRHRPEQAGEALREYGALVPGPGELTLTAFVDGGPTHHARRLARSLALQPGTLAVHVGRHRLHAEPLAQVHDPYDPVVYMRVRTGALPLHDARLVLTLGPRRWSAPLPPAVRTPQPEPAVFARARATRAVARPEPAGRGDRVDPAG